MADQSKNEKEPPISVEALYAHYQRTRAVSAQTPRPNSQLDKAMNSSAQKDDSALTENLYKHYQATRASESQDSIDAIMQKIREQDIDRVVRQEDQPSATMDSPQIQAIDAKPVPVSERSQADTPAANNSNIFKRVLLPGIAAALLAVVLIPMMMSTDSGPESLQATIPVALSDKADQTVAFIEVPQSGAFGFAESTNAAQVAFNNGVMVTDLQLLLETDEITKTRSFLRTLVSSLNTDSGDTNELSSKIQSSVVSLNDAIGAGESEAVLHDQMIEISSALEEMARESQQLDWYVAGRSVESIRVAAEYAIENSDVEPLERALQLSNKLAQPASEAPASELLPQLLQADLSGHEEFVKADELLEKANDIKLLMQ